jgi:hypothetical protein
MRKVIIAAAPMLALALLGSAVWPTVHPDVERFGDNVYETIWLWRIPAYANNPSWRVSWSWSDPLRAQARCCRAHRDLIPHRARICEFCYQPMKDERRLDQGALAHCGRFILDLTVSETNNAAPAEYLG